MEFFDGIQVGRFGAGDGTRTRGILLGKQVLYQLSYTRLQVREEPPSRRASPPGSRGRAPGRRANLGEAKFAQEATGAGEEIRTLDLFLGKEAL